VSVEELATEDALLPGSGQRRATRTWRSPDPCFHGGVVGRDAGVGLRKSDPELKAMFDKAIREAQADGTIKRLSEAVFHMDVTPR
jgi:octopine/nopaline transport system substrate-binding protein